MRASSNALCATAYPACAFVGSARMPNLAWSALPQRPRLGERCSQGVLDFSISTSGAQRRPGDGSGCAGAR